MILPEIGKIFKYKDEEGYCRAIIAPESDNPVYMIVYDNGILHFTKKTLESGNMIKREKAVVGLFG